MKRLPSTAVLLLLLLLTGTGHARAQQAAMAPSDSLEIRFRLDKVDIDMLFDDNEGRWRQFQQHFLSRYQDASPAALRLDIYSGASPEGPGSHNLWLGENRGLAVRNLVRRHLGNRVGTITVFNEGARWEAFTELIARSDEPWRDDVLRVLAETPPDAPDATHLDRRELRLRRMQGGRVWPQLERYLAPLRSGATAVLRYDSHVGTCDTIVIRDTLVIFHQMRPDTTQARRADSLFLASRHHEPVWALKTNLLLLGAGAPNVEVEFPLGRHGRWSIEGEVFFPWWTWSHNAHAEQALNVGVELRHWLGNRQRHHLLDGWHIGLAVAAGYYDIELRSKGYQGEHLNTYFNIGFQHRWGQRKQWAVDGGLGLGGFFTKYRYYHGSSIFPDGHEEHYDDHLMFQRRGHFTWVSATHANVTLAYLFPLSRREGHATKPKHQKGARHD